MTNLLHFAECIEFDPHLVAVEDHLLSRTVCRNELREVAFEPLAASPEHDQ